MSDELDRQLRAFLEDQAHDRKDGFTPQALHKAMGTLADNLLDHERRCNTRWEENDRQHASHHRRLRNLEADSDARADADTLPPPRDRFPSTHDLKEFAQRVEKAAIEGFKSPDKTPEEEVRAVVAEEEKAREEQRELQRLRAAEADRIAQEKIDKESAKTRRRNVIAGIMTAVGGAGAIELLRWMGTLHH